MTSLTGDHSARKSALERLWALVFPARCLGCNLRGEAVCQSCRSQVPRLPAKVCYRCALPTPLGALCPKCRAGRNPLDTVRAPCTFEGVVRKAVHLLKYRQVRSLAPFLATLMLEALSERPLSADVLVPVPLAPERIRERGYNQAELLAAHLCPMLGIPVEVELLERHRATPPQTSLSASERRANIKGAFRCRRDSGAPFGRVLLVDDVMTTGATLEECALVLRAAGAEQVMAVVVARDLP